MALGLVEDCPPAPAAYPPIRKTMATVTKIRNVDREFLCINYDYLIIINYILSIRYP
jgi:hypothetical protein